MLFGVDDSEVLRAEQRLRDDRVALAEAKRTLTEQCRRTLTRPSTLALLLVAGGIAGARSKTAAPARKGRGALAILGAMLRPIWALLFKGAATIAIERALHGRHDEPASAPRQNDRPPERAA